MSALPLPAPRARSVPGKHYCGYDGFHSLDYTRYWYSGCPLQRRSSIIYVAVSMALVSVLDL